mmetsp:Transcript_22513/g.57142  ORF Transcript_22513/g.57142 Transcript_22513/m.57142 type:complete len:234 (+) Transcript_22513:139-840(+)
MLLVQCAVAVLCVLRAGLLDDVAVVVDVERLLAEQKALKELDQHAVGGEELHLGALPARREDLGHEVGSYLFGLCGEHAEGELAQLRGRVVEQEVSEDHSGRERVAVGHALSGLAVIALHADGELLHERVCHLRQPALGRAVRDVAGRAAALDARADGVKDVPLGALLLMHELDGHLRAVEHAEEVHFDHCLDRLDRHVDERPAAAVDASVVDPPADGAELFLGELAEQLHAR